jgi:formylglycine-generating enzyme required for sulfatase activity
LKAELDRFCILAAKLPQLHRTRRAQDECRARPGRVLINGLDCRRAVSDGLERVLSRGQPAHHSSVEGFWIDPHLVTTTDFTRFVEATNYATVAERPLDPAAYPGADPALLVPGSLVFQRPTRRVALHDYRAWWSYVPGASWRNPEGPHSTIYGREQPFRPRRVEIG